MQDLIKEKLYKYIDTGDEKLLELMYAVAKEYVETQYELTEDEIKELNKRREIRVSGESKGYSWSDAKKIITGESNFNEL